MHTFDIRSADQNHVFRFRVKQEFIPHTTIFNEQGAQLRVRNLWTVNRNQYTYILKNSVVGVGDARE